MIRINVKALRELFEGYRNNQGFSGAVLIKTIDKVLFSFVSGCANKAYKIENELNTAFDTASITKLFTAAGIVLLESEGKINFNDNIHSIIDLSGTKIPMDIKIKHLLTHTSGIADDAEEEKGENYADLFINSPNYSMRDNKDFIKNFAYKEPNFKSVTKIYYNNCAFILLGLIIEKITGRGYREFIEEEIFKPFQMKNTFFASKEDTDRKFAEGYFYDKKGALNKNIYSFPPIGTADSGAYTTVEDLDVFIRKINGCDVYRKMLLPQTDLNIQKEDYLFTMGFGFEIREKEGEVFRIHKDGSNPGVCNITVFYPKEDITFSILGNIECNIWELQSKAEKILFS